MSPDTRREHDALGDVEVPADRLWGAQTERSLQYFAIGVDRFRFTRPVIRALGLVKKAAALANQELGELDAERARLIAAAADEVIEGRLDAEFPLVVFQTGSGTQSNMNANEVIANRANQVAGSPLGAKRPVHPNDHVNMGQSSNDAFPAVMHIAAVDVLTARLLPAVEALRGTLAVKARAFDDVVDDRPDAPAGRDADHPRPGHRWLGRADRRRHRRRAAGARRPARARARRHGRRHRAQRPPAVRRRVRPRTWQRSPATPFVRRATSSPRWRATKRWPRPAPRCGCSPER